MKIELITQEEFKKRTKYWIFTTSFYCPQCSRTTTYKERKYSERPKEWGARNLEIESYDWCDD